MSDQAPLTVEEREALIKYRDGKKHKLLPDDTFSFFVFGRLNLCPSFSKYVQGLCCNLFKPVRDPPERECVWCIWPNEAFWCAFIVFVGQVTSLSVLVDSVGLFEHDMKLNLPKTLGPEVRLCQVFAIVISVLQQQEIVQSLGSWSLGYPKPADFKYFERDEDEEKRGRNEDQCGCLRIDRDVRESISRFTWWFALLTRLSLGLLAMFATFVLILTEESIRDILLNFTAVQFISSVDDGIFELAKWGFLGENLRFLAQTISYEETTYEAKHRENSITKSEWYDKQIKDINGSDWKQKPLACLLCVLALLMQPSRCKFLWVIFLVMFSFWLVVIAKQERGQNLCQTVRVQFGDENSPALATFSGLYDLEVDWRSATVDYTELLHSSQPPARFRYCGKDKAWTFQYNDEDDPCKAQARSSPTETRFDLMETSSSSWTSEVTLRYDDARELPMQHVRMECHEENSGGLSEKECNDLCRLSDEGANCIPMESHVECNCSDDWAGPYCQLPKCNVIEIDARFDDFDQDGRRWSNRYEVLSATQTYERPVYFNRDSEDMVFFTGRRWVVTHSTLLLDDEYQNNPTAENLASYLSNTFHGHWSNYSVVFISEPVDIEHPSNGASPVGLAWFRAKSRTSTSGAKSIQVPDASRPVNAEFLCAVCSEENNPCFFDSTCDANGSCKCTNNSTGTLCQVAPTGDGKCDTYFNKLEFDWDGGDCCEHTCSDGPVYECPDKGYSTKHYPYCSDPGEQCPSSSSSRCFTRDPQSVFGDCIGGEFGASVRQSARGGIMVVGAPGCDMARVFEQVHSLRVQLGQNLDGPCGSRFGTTVDAGVFESGRKWVAVGGPDDNNRTGMVRFYSWEEKRERWAQTNETCVETQSARRLVEVGDCSGESTWGLGQSVAAASNASVLVASSLCQVIVYAAFDEISWELLSPPIKHPNESCHFGKSISVSGSGKMFSVDSICPEGSTIETYLRNDTNITYTLVESSIGGNEAFLTEDAQRLLVSDGGENRLYIWDENRAGWRSPVDVPSGLLLETSPSGSIVVVQNNDSEALAYFWNGSAYADPIVLNTTVAIPDDIPADKAHEIHVDLLVGEADETLVAIGLPDSQFNEGAVLVSSLVGPRPLQPGAASCRNVTISITPDYFPQVMSFRAVVQFSGEVLLERRLGYFSSSNVPLEETICIPIDYCATLTINEDLKDAPVCGANDGKFSLSWENGTVFAEGQGFNRTVTVEVCGNSTTTSSKEALCPSCRYDENYLRVWVLTDGNPEETSWQVVDDTGVEQGGVSSYHVGYGYHVNSICLPTDACGWIFTINDAYGDGIIAPGGYWLFRNDTEIANSTNFQKQKETVDVTRGCNQTTTLSFNPMPAMPTWVPSVTPSVAPPSSNCTRNSTSLSVYIRTGNYPEQTKWTIEDESDRIVSQSKLFTEANEEHDEEACLARVEALRGRRLAESSEGCWTFSLFHAEDDTGVGRVALVWNGEDVINEPFRNQVTKFGNCSSVEPTVAPTTPMPTSTPSEAPSLFPTHSPTVSPTPEPTLVPSKSPSSSPSIRPTVATLVPTVSPTSSPTSSQPSSSPSLAPTTKPTLTPLTCLRAARDDVLFHATKDNSDKRPRLLVGECILTGGSAMAEVYLLQKTNGNVVLYSGSKVDEQSIGPLWESKFCGPLGEYYTELQNDGNLITWKNETASTVYAWKTQQDLKAHEEYVVRIARDGTAAADVQGITIYKGTPGNEVEAVWQSTTSEGVFNLALHDPRLCGP